MNELAQNYPRLFMLFGYISLLGDKPQKEGLFKNKIDYIHILPARDKESGFNIKLSSESDRETLIISSWLKNYKKFEKWMLGLKGFDTEVYRAISSGNKPASEELLWERSVKTGTPHRSPYFSARVSTVLGEVGVYRWNGHNEHIRKKAVDYITVNSYDTQKPNTEFWVGLHSYTATNVSVTSRADGFYKLKKWMFKLPCFDRKFYNKACLESSEKPVVVWKRLPKPTVKLLPQSETKAFDMLEEGLWLENRQKLLPWGTFGKLETTPGVYKRKEKLPNPHYKKYTYILQGQQILGGLMPEELMVKSPSLDDEQYFNKEWPFTAFKADLVIGHSGKEDFLTLREHFSRFLGDPEKYSKESVGGEDNLQALWQSKNNKVSLTLRTWKPSGSDDFRAGCWLEIHYTPDLTQFYTDTYQQNLSLHDQLDYTVMDVELSIDSDYINKQQARYTPECLKPLLSESGCFLIWRDDKYGKLGIANNLYCHIYDWLQIKSMNFVGNFWRDSATECSFYVVTEQEGSPKENFVGSLNFPLQEKWKNCIKTIGKISRKPHYYGENKQYY